MKIIAVGMNYAEHDKELGGTGTKPANPIVFMKPDSAILKGGKPFFIPDFAKRFDYEAELVKDLSSLSFSTIYSVNLFVIFLINKPLFFFFKSAVNLLTMRCNLVDFTSLFCNFSSNSAILD